MPTELEQKLDEVTGGGIYPVIGYGPLEYDADRTRFKALTTNIPELSHALKFLSGVAATEYGLARQTPINTLEMLKEQHRHMFTLHDLQVRGRVEPAEMRDAAMLFGPSNWPFNAFACVDICGFSVLPPEDQLAYLLSLDNAVRSAVRRCRSFCANLGISPSFARNSTGDGYYLWHDDVGQKADAAVFALLIAIMVRSETMRARGTFPMRLKGAFALGRVFTFFDRLPVELGTGQILQNAVGPVTNDLARLIEKAKPSQILVKHFVPERGHLDPEGLLGEVKRLFDSEEHGACELKFDPSEPAPPLRVVDKHGKAHACWNLRGTIYNRFADEEDPVPQRIGLTPDPAVDITESRFRDNL